MPRTLFDVAAERGKLFDFRLVGEQLRLLLLDDFLRVCNKVRGEWSPQPRAHYHTADATFGNIYCLVELNMLCDCVRLEMVGNRPFLALLFQ